MSAGKRRSEKHQEWEEDCDAACIRIRHDCHKDKRDDRDEEGHVEAERDDLDRYGHEPAGCQQEPAALRAAFGVETLNRVTAGGAPFADPQECLADFLSPHASACVASSPSHFLPPRPQGVLDPEQVQHLADHEVHEVFDALGLEVQARVRGADDAAGEGHRAHVLDIDEA